MPSQPVPSIRFADFSSVILNSFHKDISLGTALVILFSILENPSTFDHHSRQKFKRLDKECSTRYNGWISAFSRALISRCPGSEVDLLGVELEDRYAVSSVTDAVDALATTLNFTTFDEGGNRIRLLYPFEWQSIDPVFLLVPSAVECKTDKTCKPYGLHVITRPRDVAQVTLIRGSRIHEFAHVVNGACNKCKTSYAADRETFPDTGTPGRNFRSYLSDAPCLKIGQSLWCDRSFSNAVVMGIYSFHASPSAYTQFWNHSFTTAHSESPASPSGTCGPRSSAFKLGRRQVWQAFIQESIRTVAGSRNFDLTLRDGLPIEEVTEGAFGILGNQGIFRESKAHTCNECTQPYKEAADVPGSTVGGDMANGDDVVQERGYRPSSGASDLTATETQGENEGLGREAGGSPQSLAPLGRVVKMVVVDGIVMGTTHCAYPDCTQPLANHRGESFCWTHKELWGNRCRVVDCIGSRLPKSYACENHQDLWRKYQQEHSRATLAGIRRALQRPGDADAAGWQQTIPANSQRHDEPQSESTPRAHYFGPNRYYCVEIICAPCGTVIAWAVFAKSESPTKILQFLARVYPDQQERPSFICIDKACLVLRTAVSNGSWEEWKKTSRFIVDTYHYINHKATDDLCRSWCNPAPANGSQPNLVIVAHDDNGRPYLKRAFNTQACEQLNSWLGGFDSILKRMVMSNFRWFLHVMLWYHTRLVIRRQGARRAPGEDDADLTGDDDSSL